MYGNNEVSGLIDNRDGKLLVNSVFATLQGEGPDAGTPAIFVRLSKCNLRCWFCDTEFESGALRELDDLVKVVVGLARDNKCSLVVITGGEPFLQSNIYQFITELNRWNCNVSVETAGTIFDARMLDLFNPNDPYKKNKVVCSPKTPKLAKGITQVVSAYKYVIEDYYVAKEDGLPTTNTQEKSSLVSKAPARPPINVPRTNIFLQPMDCGDKKWNELNVAAALDSCRKFGYRLSLQLQKQLGLP